MEEENDDEKPLVGVKLVCTTDFHHDRCILCQRYDKKFETRRIPFNPVGNGWYIENEKLFPSKGLKEFPADFIVLCGCKGRCRGRCKCLAAGQVCTPFCHKNAGEKCKNKQ